MRHRVPVVDRSALGGGATSPGVELPSAGWRIDGPYGRVEEACRSAIPPLIGRIEADSFVVDFRTLSPGDDDEAAAVLIRHVLAPGEAASDA